MATIYKSKLKAQLTVRVQPRLADPAPTSRLWTCAFDQPRMATIDYDESRGYSVGYTTLFVSSRTAVNSGVAL